MISRRRKHKKMIDEQAEAADQHLQRAQELAAEASKISNDLRTTRLRNHFGEAVLASFQPKPKKGMPWTR